MGINLGFGMRRLAIDSLVEQRISATFGKAKDASDYAFVTVILHCRAAVDGYKYVEKTRLPFDQTLIIRKQSSFSQNATALFSFSCLPPHTSVYHRTTSLRGHPLLSDIRRCPDHLPRKKHRRYRPVPRHDTRPIAV